MYKATQREIIRSGNLSAQAIQEMGFHPDDIGRALVLTSFSFDKALLLLLNGIDVKRTKQDSNARYDSVGFRPVRRSNLWCVLLALLGSWFGGKQGRRVDPGSAIILIIIITVTMIIVIIIIIIRIIIIIIITIIIACRVSGVKL